MLATSYPLLDIFLTMLWVFLFVVWIFLLFSILVDIFRSHDLSGWTKALWVLGIIVFPALGVLVYLIVRGAKMHERGVQQARRRDDAVRDYVRGVAGTPPSTADELAKLADLRSRGALSEEEYERQKARLLS